MHYPDASQNVIFDRTPVEYVAYSQFTANHGTTDIDDQFVNSLVPIVRNALKRIDILAFVPITDRWQVSIEDNGIRPVDHDYRAEFDQLFKQSNRFIVKNVLISCLAATFLSWLNFGDRPKQELKN